MYHLLTVKNASATSYASKNLKQRSLSSLLIVVTSKNTAYYISVDDERYIDYIYIFVHIKTIEKLKKKKKKTVLYTQIRTISKQTHDGGLFLL